MSPPRSLTDLNIDVLLLIFDCVRDIDKKEHDSNSQYFASNFMQLASTCGLLRSLVEHRLLRRLAYRDDRKFSLHNAKGFLLAIESNPVLQKSVRTLTFRPETKDPKTDAFKGAGRKPFDDYARLQQIFRCMPNITTLNITIPHCHVSKFKKAFGGADPVFFPNVTDLTTCVHGIFLNLQCPKATKHTIILDAWKKYSTPSPEESSQEFHDDFVAWMRPLSKATSVKHIVFGENGTHQFRLDSRLLATIATKLAHLEILDLGSTVLRADLHHLTSMALKIQALKPLVLPTIWQLGICRFTDVPVDMASQPWRIQRHFHGIIGQLIFHRCTDLQRVGFRLSDGNTYTLEASRRGEAKLEQAFWRSEAIVKQATPALERACSIKEWAENFRRCTRLFCVSWEHEGRGRVVTITYDHELC